MNKAVIILGPTAVGKSKLAVELAKKINGEIISADSMQVYRGMDIGTAKLTSEEQQGIPHHLIDIKNPDEEWTVSNFVELTNKLIGEITKRGKTPIIVGGTGLYLWSLLEGYVFPIAPSDKKIREKLEKVSLPTLYAQLSTIDPPAAQKINPNDKKRVVRALEVYELTGKRISELQELRAQNTEHPSISLGAGRAQEYILIGLNLPREQLYERINDRVDQMIENGLIEEVKELLNKGFSKDLPSFQALGYKEAIEHLEGKWTLEKMVYELKKRTRHFARRQMTWFKRFKDVEWFEGRLDPATGRCWVDVEAILRYINNI